EGGRGCPVEVATVGCRTGVLGLLGQIFELGTGLQLGDDGFGVFLLVHQDVAGVVFLVAGLGLELVVFGLDVGVGDRVLLQVVGDQGADDDGLAGQFQLVLDVGAVGEA